MKDRFGFDWSKIQGAPYWSKPMLGRRMFFRHVASAVGGYFLLPSRPMETIAKAAVTTRNTAKNVIFIMMTGAPSHTDTFDLKEGAWTPASFKPTDFNGVRFPQGLMPIIAAQMDSIALLRSVRAWAGVHGLMQAWVQIGRNPVSALAKISPHIGSVVSMELNKGVGLPVPAHGRVRAAEHDPSGWNGAVRRPLRIAAGYRRRVALLQ